MKGYGIPTCRNAGTPRAGTSLLAAYEALQRNDLYKCVGLPPLRSYENSTQASANQASVAECGGTNSANGSFDTFLFAYPEVIPVDASIVSLGFYGKMTIAMSSWVAVFSNTTLSGNPYPGSSLGVFEKVYTGAGDNFVSGAVSVSVRKGDVLWFVTQTSNNNLGRGFRRWEAFRPIWGEDKTNPFSTTVAAQHFNYHGIITPAAVAYNAALASFPNNGVLLPSDVYQVGASGGATTPNRPSIYYKLSF